MKLVLLLKRDTQTRILSKGGKALPPGSMRVWGGKEYVKIAPGEWRLKVADGKNRPASLTEHIHTILHGSYNEREKLDGKFFYLADTPEFMRKLGLKGDYFTVRYGVIARHSGKDPDHTLTKENWTELCSKITEPFAIAKYRDGFRLFTDVTINNRFVAVGVDVKSIGQDMEINSISTAFGVRERIIQGVIYTSEKITPEQAALLEGLDSDPYPPAQG